MSINFDTSSKFGTSSMSTSYPGGLNTNQINPAPWAIVSSSEKYEVFIELLDCVD